MMDNFVFSSELKGLAAAFDRKGIGAETEAEYYRAFKYLTEGQWQSLCQWAKSHAEHFPRISALKTKAYELGYFKALDVSERPDPWVVVECKCGRDFVVPSVLQPRIGFPCECGLTYPHGYVLKRAVRGVLRMRNTPALVGSVQELLEKVKAEIPKDDPLPF